MIELLAPAGTKEAFYAAVNNGADAVYMGGTNFSARAFAGNFNHEEISELVKYAHLRNVKVYITVNTLLNEFEFNNCIKDIDFYYHNDVDALIIQDLGLFYYIRKHYPDFELHASTQMHIHNLSGVKVAKELGFKRCVVARESSLKQINEFTKCGIEIETFCHGAICVSYSGQCLLSSATKNRSANKGMCAQCCRLKYELYDQNNNKVDTDTDYILSPKDMLLLEDVPGLIKAGVSSLKIEGRMKSPAYVGYVTSLYRKAIDVCYSGEIYHPSLEELKKMKVLFNRTYTNSFLIDSKEDVFNQKAPNHLGIELGKVIGFKNGDVLIKLSDQLNQFDGIRIVSKGKEDGFIVNMMKVKDKLTAKAFKGEVVSLKSRYRFDVNDKVYKTIDHNFEKALKNNAVKRIPIDFNVYIKPNEKVRITCREFDYESDITPKMALNAPLNSETITKSFSKLKDTPYVLNRLNIETENAFLRVAEMNEIRNDFVDKLNLYRLNQFKREKNTVSFETSGSLIDEESDRSQFDFNPVINLQSAYSNSNKQIISEIGGLLNKCEKIGYYTLNITNSYAYEFLKRLGFKGIVVSTELNDLMLKELIKQYRERNQVDIKPYVYEDERTLMFIRNNPFGKYRINDGYLKDKDNTYRIVSEDGYVRLVETKKREIDIDKNIYKVF